MWTSGPPNPDQITATWTADDAESGVNQYEYALWSTPSGFVGLKKFGVPSEIRPFTSAGGRTSVTINQLALNPGTPIYIAVRATNGQGGVSSTGVSLTLRYDPTPPVFPVGAGLTLIATSPATVSSKSAGLTPACPVPAPPYPSAPLPTIGAAMTLPLVWGGTLAFGPAGNPPVVTFSRPDATDPESGVYTYLYRISEQPITTNSGTDWNQISGRMTTFNIQGAPLNYTSQFYVAVVAKNFAGSVSQPITYGAVPRCRYVGPDRTGDLRRSRRRRSPHGRS